MIKSIFAFITTLLIYLFDGFDVAMECLLIVIVIDYISGMIKAFYTKELSSRIGFKGILKKVAILLIVMLAVLVDRVTGSTGAIRTLVIYYFVANEGLSIIENLGKANLPIPKAIKNALKTLKNQSNNGKD